MAYLLTVSRMDFSKRKQRWSDPSYTPRIRKIGTPDSPIAYPGLLVLVDDDGRIRRSVPFDSPKGMLWTDAGLLVACFSEIRSCGADLDDSITLVRETWCNDLHSLRPSPRGLLVAAAGVDAAFELAPDGKTLWEWWAADHGFTTDQRGEPRLPAKEEDHRNLVYPVEMQTTHINAIAALDGTTFLATLFHEGALVAVDVDTGECSVLLEGLGRPHAVRVLGNGMVTLADTTAGTAILGRVQRRRFEVLQRIDTGTSWLHDAHFDGERWMFVDGANSRVLHADATGAVLQIDTFDPEWCLYEVLPWPDPLVRI